MSALAHGKGVLGTDYRPQEVLASSFLAASVPVWLFILIGISRLHAPAEGVHIEKGDVEQAVKIIPMIDFDSPLLKLGGGKAVKLPDVWAPPPVPQRKDEAVVSTKGKDDVKEIPDRRLEVYDGGTAPDPDAETTDNPEPDDAGPADADAPDGGGSQLGSPDGSVVDKRKGRALNRYKGRLRRFFKIGFRCANRPEGAPGGSAGAYFAIGGDGTVLSFTFTPSNIPEIDAIAKSTAQSKVGQQIPPYPEKYPEMKQSGQSVAYGCK